MSLLTGPGVGKAGDWPQWRGPTGVGYTDETGLPLSWDGKTGENVLWKASLKGTTGHSSPVVWGDRVFITTAVKQTLAAESPTSPSVFATLRARHPGLEAYRMHK